MMQELEVTWEKAVRVWWSLTWRTLAISLPISFIVGFLLGFAGAMMGLDKEGIQGFSTLIGLIVGLTAAVFSTKMALSKKYSTFRIALIPIRDQP